MTTTRGAGGLRRLEERVALSPPAFRFVFYPITWRLVVYPRGFGDDAATLGLPGDWSGAVGDILAIDNDHAIATFSCLPHDRREIVETSLEHWGMLDGWLVGFLIDLIPLAKPQPAGPPPWIATCPQCGAQTTSRKSPENVFARWSWIPTQCAFCRGRMSWVPRIG